MSRNADLLSADCNVLRTLRMDDAGEALLTERRGGVRTRAVTVVFASSASWRSAGEFAASLGDLSTTNGATEVIVLVWPSCVLASDMRRTQGLVANGLHIEPRLVHAMQVPTFIARAAEAVLPTGDLEDWAPTTFVEPNLRIPDSEYEVNALRFIVEQWALPSWTGPRLLVVLAPAGVGKTTLANGVRDRMLQRLPARRDAARPLVLRSSTWSGLKLDQATLDDIWLRAINENYRAALPIETLRSFIQAGAILPILDGFDELCSHSDSFNPSDTLEALESLVTSSDSARVLVTAREGYWDSVLGELGAEVTYLRVTLQQFGNAQVDEFLKKRFPGPAGDLRRNDARSLIDRLSGSRRTHVANRAEALGGLPLVVEMVCDIVEDGADHSVFAPSSIGTNPVNAVIQLACRRERQRRGLELSEAEQIELLTELAVYHQSQLSMDDLLVAARVLFPALSSRQREQILPHHQLLKAFRASIAFKYEFVRDHLRAQHLAEELALAPAALSASAKRLLSEEGHGQGPFWDHLAGRVQLGDVPVASYWAARRKIDLSLHTEDAIRDERYASGVLQLALRVSTSDRPTLPSERRDAGRRLLGLLGCEAHKVIDGAVLLGPIRDVGLDGVVFRNCVFENSGFMRCELAGVRFDSCRFVGGFEIVNCSGGDRVTWPSGAGVSALAAAAFNSQKGFRSQVTGVDVADAAHQVLSRFCRGNRLRTMDIANVLTRSMRQSQLVMAVFEELEGAGIIETHTVSGVGRSAGRNVSDSAMREVLRFLEDRAIGPVLSPIVAAVEVRMKQA